MSKKKSTIKKVSEKPVEQIEPEPQDDVPSRQIEEVHEKEAVEQPTEPETVAEVEPQSTVEVVAEPAPVEVVVKPEPPAKPKPLTLISLHNELNALRQVVDEQGKLIIQLMEAPTRQRKSPASNGKIQIRDKQTGKIYPSKNNVYQSLLKAGELKELVDANVFGPNPAKNSFGCYNLFRAWPNRFEEVHDQEQSI